ncbi:hypothetical protein TD95_000448 [Thielaviopsis punctulata]|uniref:MARVEL domain-containing protein n=1 Tax=Thielaviopsis punctulata TaxID=72032 RepID=A0A0F4ZH50_9PEZI|nr:hypothetical protein TD95_000448 [Thielaviopsis punctulata]
MFFAITFIFWRIAQILTLICLVGLTAWFVDIFNSQNLLTPDYILVLFIVSVLALAWAMFTLFSYSRSSANGTFIAWVDILFVGAFIGAVYCTRHIGPISCSSVARSVPWHEHFGALYEVRGVNGLNPDKSKPCAMIKASFAFGIMNTIFFFITAIAAWFHGDDVAAFHYRGKVTRVRRSSHSRSRSRGRHSHSRSRSGHRGGSRHSRRSYSHSRVYV